MKYTDLRSALAGSAAICAAAIASPASAQEKTFNVAAQPAATGIPELARQADIQILASGDVVRGKRTNVVRGRMRIEKALKRLLAGTGLYVASNDGRVVTLSGSREPGVTSINSFLGRPVSSSGLPSPDAEEANADGGTVHDAAADQQEIVVTGTNIKGVRDQFSPVITITRSRIDEAGQSSVADVIRSLPQNFSGGLGGAPTTFGGGSAIAPNLRGLGNETTLTLVNGRRLPGIGRDGNVVDISVIPLAAIDRVDVLTDGASAIYGADAIGGVVNIILNRHFEGVETRLRLGTATQGGGTQAIAAATVGGHLGIFRGLVSYEYETSAQIRSSDRDATVGALDPTDLMPDTQRHSVFASGQLEISPRWAISADALYSHRVTQAETAVGTFIFDNEARPNSLALSIASDFQLGDGWVINASYARGLAQETNIRDDYNLARINTRDLVTTSETQLDIVEANAGGPIFPLPGGDARVFFGVQTRRERFDGFSGFKNGATNILQDLKNDRRVWAAFGEAYWPVLSGLSGVERLAVSTSLRYDHYSDVGGSVNPKLGLVYAPTADLSLRATYSTSFRAPRLQQLVNSFSAGELVFYEDPGAPSGRSLALTFAGNRTDLAPESSRSFNLGFDFTPSWLRGLAVRATYFDLRYDDQVFAPFNTLVSNVQGIVTVRNDFVTPRRNPTEQEIGTILALLPSLTNRAGGASPLGATVILDQRSINASITQVRGLDLSVAFSRETPLGSLRVFADATYLSTFYRQVAPSSPRVTQLDFVGLPLDFRLRAGAGLRTRRTSWNLFLNHADGYRQSAANEAPIASWTTIDMSASRSFGDQSAPFTVAFAVRNLFDTDPPLAVPLAIAQRYSYDVANAEAVGRLASVTLTKRW